MSGLENMMDLSVVIPVYNEEENVIELAAEVLRALEGREMEITQLSQTKKLLKLPK